MNVSLFGNRIFIDIKYSIKLRWSYWIRVGPDSVTGIIITRGEYGLRVTEKKAGRCQADRSDAAISPRKP